MVESDSGNLKLLLSVSSQRLFYSVWVHLHIIFLLLLLCRFYRQIFHFYKTLALNYHKDSLNSLWIFQLFSALLTWCSTMIWRSYSSYIPLLITCHLQTAEVTSLFPNFTGPDYQVYNLVLVLFLVWFILSYYVSLSVKLPFHESLLLFLNIDISVPIFLNKCLKVF